MKLSIFVFLFFLNINCFSQERGVSYGVGGERDSGTQREFKPFENVFWKGDNKRISHNLNDSISWALLNRKLVKSENISTSCIEKGRLVFQVKVDNKGNVIEVSPFRGSTNSSICLVKPILNAIRNYKWNSNKSAPEIQIGFVVVELK